jgi:hypothetical protein
MVMAQRATILRDNGVLVGMLHAVASVTGPISGLRTATLVSVFPGTFRKHPLYSRQLGLLESRARQRRLKIRSGFRLPPPGELSYSSPPQVPV